MPFPTNPTVGDTYVENNNTYKYLGPVNGWYRSSVSPSNDTTYIGSDGAPGGVSRNTQIIFNDNGSLAGDTGLVFNKTTKSVGLNTSSPGKPFTLQQSSDAAFRIQTSTGDTYDIYRKTSNGILQFEGNQQTYSGYNFSTTPTGGSLTSRLFIASNGSIGVGATNPSAFGTFAVRTATSVGGAYGSVSGHFSDGATGSLSIKHGAGEIGFFSDGATALTFYNSSTEKFRCDTSGRILIGTNSNSGTALLQVNGDKIRVATAKTPASATDTGVQGEVCWDADYIYVCTATNTWKRAALATW